MGTLSTARLSLARVLGLRPLDRVQVNSRAAIEDTRYQIPLGRSSPWDLPYYFFQRVISDDQLELRSPGGCPCNVSPLDISDVIRGTPISVRAMPRSVFLERLKLHHTNRTVPGEDCYAKAYVLHALKNRWGQVDVAVVFEDDSLNFGGSFMAPVHPDDRGALGQLAKRSTMPVMSGRGGAGYSADRGTALAQHADARVTSSFIRASLKGLTAEACLLLEAGARRKVWSDVRKLRIVEGGSDE